MNGQNGVLNVILWIGHNSRAYSKHVMQWDVLGNGHDKGNLGFYGLLDCGRGLMSRNIDGGGVRF